MIPFHSKNVMHRDLKLENILINFDDFPNLYKQGCEYESSVKFVDSENFTVKIADLGLAREADEEGVASTICVLQ